METDTITSEELQRCTNLRAVYRLMWRRSGKELKELASDLEEITGRPVCIKMLSRVMDGREEDRRYLPDDLHVPLMVACGSTALIRWLSWRVGQPDPAELQDRLDREQELREQERETFIRTVARIRGLQHLPRMARRAAAYSLFDSLLMEAAA